MALLKFLYEWLFPWTVETPPEAPNLPQEATSTPAAPSVPTTPNPAPMTTVPATVPESEKPDPDALLPWDMTGKLSHANWHNVRALCDLEGLTHQQKEELCATVWGESDFYAHAHCYNYAFKKDGTRYLASTDNGICQWNDYYHGSEITPHDAEYDPEKAVRLMCRYFKLGRQNQWVAHSSGRYKQFLGKTL